MRSKLFYGLVGFAAFFIVLQHVQNIGYDLWELWEDRDSNYTPTYSEVSAPDAVERPVQKIRPDVGGTDVSAFKTEDGVMSDRRYLIVPTQLQHAQGSIDAGFSDDIIIVTGSKARGMPSGLRLPKSSDRAKDKDGNVVAKTRHLVQRACQGSTYTNLLLHNRQAKTTKPLFEVPLSVIGHQLIMRDGQTTHVVAYTAILDTSQDDSLTCQDFIHMAIFDIAADSLHWVDMGRAEPLTVNHQYNQTKGTLLRRLSTTEYVMGIGVDENEDGLFDPKAEIIEMAVLNIADKSFEKMVTASDLAGVQDILYRRPIEE